MTAASAERLHLAGFSTEPATGLPPEFGTEKAEGGHVIFQHVDEGFGAEGRQAETEKTLAAAWAALCRVAERRPVAAFRFGQVVTSPADAARAADLTGMGDRLADPRVRDAEEWSVAAAPVDGGEGSPEGYLARLSAARNSRQSAFETLQAALTSEARAIQRRGRAENGRERWQVLIDRERREALLAALAECADKAGLDVTATGPEPILTFLPGDDE